MKERPIIFSGPMVRAILDGRKTQTRRVVKPQPPTVEAVRELCGDTFSLFTDCRASSPAEFRVAGPVFAVRQLCGQQEWKCPYGCPGDRMWVRETFVWNPELDRPDECKSPEHCFYRADGEIWDQLEDIDGFTGWKSSRFMPRWASRITLEVTAVRVERLQDIEDYDCIQEGIRLRSEDGSELKDDYEKLWDSINGKKHPWESNPWVWVIEFKRIGAAE